MLNYFLILILSHLLADFVFQNEDMVKAKESDDIKERNRALFYHSLWFLITSLILFFIIEGVTWWPSTNIRGLPWLVVIAIFLLSVVHGIVDLFKVFLKRKLMDSYSVLLFILDQMVHIGLILFFVGYFKRLELWKNINVLMEYLNTNTQTTFKPTHGQNILLLFCLVIIVTSFANICIKVSLSPIKLQVISGKDEEKQFKIGRYIGSVERILTVAGVVAGSYEAIAALYAAKAAIRFNDAKKIPGFSEYFILGTSTSALFGILIGLLVKKYLELI